MEKPYEGFFMDKVYRIHQPGEDPATGEYVKGIQIKAIITQPEPEQVLKPGNITILGAAYGGEKDIATVEVSTDGGASWQPADFIGPHEPFAWRQWQYVWSGTQPGHYTILARATTTDGETQPMQASWNKLGYNNNGVQEHGIPVEIVPLTAAARLVEGARGQVFYFGVFISAWIGRSTVWQKHQNKRPDPTEALKT